MKRWHVEENGTWLAPICLATLLIRGSLGTNASSGLGRGDMAIGLTARASGVRETTTSVPDRLALITSVLHTTTPPDSWMKTGAWFGEFGHHVQQKQKQTAKSDGEVGKRRRRVILNDVPVDQEASDTAHYDSRLEQRTPDMASDLERSPAASDERRGGMWEWFHDRRDEENQRAVSTTGVKQRTRDISKALSDLAHALAEDGSDTANSGLPAHINVRDNDDQERRCEDDGWEESWESWTSCSATCQADEGSPCPSRSRARVDGCPGKQHQECNCLTYCPVDCSWNDWKDWTECSQTCEGQRTRTRSLTPARHGGVCTHEARELMETKPCNSLPCPVDCEWGDWGAFGACKFVEKTCNAWSSRFRHRVKNVNEAHGGVCIGDYTSHERCRYVPCPIDCQWHSWGDWSECSHNCAGGKRSRHRRVYREALHGGHLCDGQDAHVQQCNTQPCPVNCIWGPWGEFTDCTKSCGGGAKERSRGYQVHVANGGVPCDGDADELLPCNVFYCAVDCLWDDWSDWSLCSATCGGGTKTASRSYLTAARWGGSQKTCPGGNSATVLCNEMPCPASLQQSSVTHSLLRRH
mmetsp:Transcript_65291/g.120266  ORF Transcript_65291/g.120266 Transcript_65291/m.120266 type:complete len:581 (+) Transcript_65291:119-1861(+)